MGHQANGIPGRQDQLIKSTMRHYPIPKIGDTINYCLTSEDAEHINETTGSGFNTTKYGEKFSFGVPVKQDQYVPFLVFQIDGFEENKVSGYILMPNARDPFWWIASVPSASPETLSAEPGTWCPKMSH